MGFLVNFAKSIESIFSKKEKLRYPSDFALIRFTEVAKQKGIFDDYNKEIVIYKNGKLSEVIPYTEQEATAIREVYEIPIEEEKMDEDEKFEFNSTSPFGEIGVK